MKKIKLFIVIVISFLLIGSGCSNLGQNPSNTDKEGKISLTSKMLMNKTGTHIAAPYNYLPSVIEKGGINSTTIYSEDDFPKGSFGRQIPDLNAYKSGYKFIKAERLPADKLYSVVTDKKGEDLAYITYDKTKDDYSAFIEDYGKGVTTRSEITEKIENKVGPVIPEEDAYPFAIPKKFTKDGRILVFTYAPVYYGSSIALYDVEKDKFVCKNNTSGKPDNPCIFGGGYYYFYKDFLIFADEYGPGLRNEGMLSPAKSLVVKNLDSEKESTILSGNEGEFYYPETLRNSELTILKEVRNINDKGEPQEIISTSTVKIDLDRKKLP